MEKDWERTIQFIKIDNEKIRSLFNNIYEFSGINSVAVISEGCRTSNYIIESISKKKYLLKLCYKDKQNHNAEKNILKLLENIVPVQKVYIISELPWNKNIEYSIYDYIEGESIARYISTNNISEKIIKSVAKVLAYIHKKKFTSIGFLDNSLKIDKKMKSVMEWYSISMGENAKRRLGKELVYKIDEVVKDNKSELLKLDKNPRLVHGDFQGNNILIKNELVVGIIDWEFAMAGHPISDIGQFFRYDKYFNENMREVFEKEYNKLSDYKLPNNWYKISKIRDLISLIQLIDSSEDMPIKHTEIKMIIENTINSYL